MHTCAKFGPDRYSCLASFPHFLICDPLTPSKCPLGLEWLICLAYVYSLVNLYTCAKFGPDRSSRLDDLPDLRIDDPLTAPHAPRVSRGCYIFFSSCPFPYEYAYVCQIWSRSVQMFGIFPTYVYVCPPNPL